MKCTFSTLLLLLPVLLFAQDDPKIHSPADILKILSDSKLSYEVGVSDIHIACKDRSDNVNTSDLYQVKKDGQFMQKQYSFGDDAYKLLEKAEGFFRDGYPDSARRFYKLVLKQNPDCALLLTYIGQTYEQQKDMDNAMKYYQMAIDANYFDYMAHWYLGYALSKKGSNKKAVDEVTIAHVLNRNNPRILKELKQIYSNAGKSYNDWCFEPQMQLDKATDGKISISSTIDWSGYAMAKAVWKYEPGYRESMGGKEGSYTSMEDRECLLIEAMMLEGAKDDSWKSTPALSVLHKAIEKKMFQEYLYFEVILPKYPSTIYMLPKEFIEQIKDYVVAMRS
jgi:tetratricopeptide (TPR) repeat protein